MISHYRSSLKKNGIKAFENFMQHAVITCPSAFHHMRVQQEGPNKMPASWYWIFQPVRNKFLFFMNYSVSCIVITAEEELRHHLYCSSCSFWNCLNLGIIIDFTTYWMSFVKSSNQDLISRIKRM